MLSGVWIFPVGRREPQKGKQAKSLERCFRTFAGDKSTLQSYLPSSILLK